MALEPFFTRRRPGMAAASAWRMVRETALAHGGLVEFTSDAEGTAFRILLPLA